MSSRVNCFQIIGQEAIEGIPLFADKVSFRTELPFWGEHRWVKEGRILYGRPSFTIPESDSFILLCSPEEVSPKYWMVYIEVPTLNFGGQPFLEGLNLWPGGEWHSLRQLWRMGPPTVDPRKLRQTVDRCEIWVLENHEQVLLIDQFGGVRTLRRQYDQLQFSQVDRFTMADYICNRGVSMTTHAGALWAFKNLEHLQEGFPDADFSQQLTAVHRHLQRLTVKIS